MTTSRGEALGKGRAEIDHLEMRVVEYPDAADRCTLYPPGLVEHERMTHWISADRDAFVPLDLNR